MGTCSGCGLWGWEGALGVGCGDGDVLWVWVVGMGTCSGCGLWGWGCALAPSLLPLQLHFDLLYILHSIDI